MLLANQPFWSRDNLPYLTALIYVVLGIGGVMSWVFLHTADLRRRARVPGWLDAVALFAWFEWAVWFSRLFLPESFSLRSLVEAFYRRDWSLLPSAVAWGVGVAVVPAALLFAAFWLSAQLVMQGHKRKKAAPWTHFEPGGYRLNWKRIFNIPAVVVYDMDRDNPVTTTVGKVLNEVLPGRFNIPGEPRGEKAPVPDSEEDFFGVEVRAPNGRVIEMGPMGRGQVESEHFAADLVEVILQLFRITEEVGECVLYFYEGGPFSERQKFFIVHGDKIVLENFALMSPCGEYFDHSVLRALGESGDCKKANENDEDEGTRGAVGEDVDELTLGQDTAVRWWYRRFYVETRTGQIKVFWNEPIYNYVPPERREAERDARLRRVEWVGFGIAGLLVAHLIFKWF